MSISNSMGFQGKNISQIPFTYVVSFHHWSGKIKDPEAMILGLLKLAPCKYVYYVFEKNKYTLWGNDANYKYDNWHSHLLVYTEVDLPLRLEQLNLSLTNKGTREVKVKEMVGIRFYDKVYDVPYWKFSAEGIKIHVEKIIMPENIGIYIHKYSTKNMNEDFIRFDENDRIKPYQVSGYPSMSKTELAHLYGVCYRTFRGLLLSKGKDIGLDVISIFRRRVITPLEVEAIVKALGVPENWKGNRP